MLIKMGNLMIPSTPLSANTFSKANYSHRAEDLADLAVRVIQETSARHEGPVFQNAMAFFPQVVPQIGLEILTDREVPILLQDAALVTFRRNSTLRNLTDRASSPGTSARKVDRRDGWTGEGLDRLILRARENILMDVAINS